MNGCRKVQRTLAVCGLLCATGCSRPTSIPDTADAIVFSVRSIDEGVFNSDVHVIKVDGSVALQLTRGIERIELSPCWIDSSTVAFISFTQQRTYGEGQIISVDLVAGRRREVRKAGALAFKEIAHLSEDEIVVNHGNWDFYTVNTTTGDSIASIATTYHHGLARLVHPRVSPNSRYVVFAGVDTVKRELLSRYPTGNIQLGDSLDDIFVLDRKDGTLMQVTDTHCCDRDPAWYVDGENIVFSSNRSGNYELYMMSAVGSDVRVLTSTKRIDELQPTVSPDGRRIAFTARVEERPPYETWIWTMNLDGTDLRRLAEGCEPDWSPR